MIDLRDHTIIVGFGLNGRYLARVLRERSIPYCILEMNPQTVRDAQKDGEPIGYRNHSPRRLTHAAQARAAANLVGAAAAIIGRQHRGKFFALRKNFCHHPFETGCVEFQ